MTHHLTWPVSPDIRRKQLEIDVVQHVAVVLNWREKDGHTRLDEENVRDMWSLMIVSTSETTGGEIQIL